MNKNFWIKAITLSIMKKSDIKKREDVFLLVCQFYDKVRKDEVLGPFFI
jgi:truncated hemoglobin YjbI